MVAQTTELIVTRFVCFRTAPLRASCAGGSSRAWSVIRGLGVSVMCMLGSHGAATASMQSDVNSNANVLSVTPGETQMWMTVGDRRFAIALADSATTRALIAQLPMTLDMSELNGNEKHVELQKVLPTAASRPGTIRSGDIMLFGAKTVVVFYETFGSSYAYTRLGRLDNPAGLADALGRGDVRVVFSAD